MKWEEAANRVERDADGQENRLVVAAICRYVGESEFSDQLDIDVDWLPQKIYMSPSDGSWPEKRLKAESITDNRIEFCLSDNKTHQEKYFFPHAPAAEGLQRFKEIIRILDWSEEVKPDETAIDKFLSSFSGSKSPNSMRAKFHSSIVAPLIPNPITYVRIDGEICTSVENGTKRFSLPLDEITPELEPKGLFGLILGAGSLTINSGGRSYVVENVIRGRALRRILEK